MNLLLKTLLIAGIFSGRLFSHPETKEEFVAACEDAWNSAQIEKLDELTYAVGASEADKERQRKSRLSMMSGTRIKECALLPVPEDFQSVKIGKGMKSEPTYDLSGVLKLELQRDGKASGAVSIPYAIIDRKYYLLAAKTTKLNWSGPPDVLLTYELRSSKATDVDVEYSWNASGVDQVRKVKFTVNGVTENSMQGQHVNWIKVLTKSSDSDVTLALAKDGKEHFKSQPLRGAGMIEYKKSDR